MRDRSIYFKIGLLILMIFIAFAFVVGRTAEEALPDDASGMAVMTAVPKGERELTEVKKFTGLEFKAAFDNLAQPNITPIVIAPSFTGNDLADDRIVQLAEARGYVLRQASSGVLNEIDGLPVQEPLIENWQQLQAAAIADDVNLDFVSGYRSIEDQTSLFFNNVLKAGATVEGIATGADDSVVNSVLATIAPPGYSRHHSGYTIDVRDPGFEVFANSTAYVWLSANNFENAKKHGFIPSYPEGLLNQGPNPESWEFVWVGRSVTHN